HRVHVRERCPQKTMSAVRDGAKGESSALSATDGLAIPDGNDASSRVLLLDGFSRLGVPAWGGGATDDDDSFANLNRVHGESCSGNSVCISVRIDILGVNKPPSCLGGKVMARKHLSPNA